MKTLNITFTDEEFLVLIQNKKPTKSWHDHVLDVFRDYNDLYDYFKL